MPPYRPPPRKSFPRNESAFHKNLTVEDRQELLKLQTLREIPKSRYATQLCITALPSGRSRKTVYSHVEVYKNVESIATELREAGVRPQTICAFILTNNVESIIYFQALQWIGAIAVPINPTLTEKEINLVLKETQAFTLVSPLIDEDERATDQLYQKINAACSTLDIIQWYVTRSTNKGVYIDRMGIRAAEDAAWAGGASDFKYDPSETSLRLATPDDDDCLVVDMSHRSLASAVREFSKTYSLTADMSTLLFFPFHDMQGLMCALATMYSGGNIVIQERTSFDSSAILNLCKENKINWFSTNADTVLGIYENVTTDPGLLEGMNLSFIRSVNGVIDADTMREIEPVLRTPVLEAYGTPETCVLVSANQDVDFRPGTCGCAVNGCEIVILNEDNQKLPIGDEGNIAVFGLHICRGFNNSDYANEQCFVDLPDGEETKRFFITGDQGILSTDGYLRVTSEWMARGRAAELARAEEEIIRSRTALQTAEALKAAELRKAEEEKRRLAEKEKLEREDAERLKRQAEQAAKEAEEARLREEERLRKEEEERNRKEAEERQLREASSSASSRATSKESESNGPSSSSASQSTAGKRSPSQTTETETGMTSMSSRSVRMPDTLSRELLQQIVDRLERIETNQRRLEEDMEGAHRAEMERLRSLMDMQGKERSTNVHMDMSAINSAMHSAAEAAQKSSEDTLKATQAAEDAKKAAEMAAKRQNNENKLTVIDPNEVKKTVVVSLDQVDEAMQLHPSVMIARSFGRPDRRTGMEVFCAILPRQGSRVSEPWLMLHAQEALPAAYVPKKFYYKDDLTRETEREELAQDDGLKRMSEFAGYVAGGASKAPAWTRDMAKRHQQMSMDRIKQIRGGVEYVQEDSARTTPKGEGGSSPSAVQTAVNKT